ncbi:TIGR01244 family sulfur transferase [Methylophilus flavus]|uniref:TIGR01244 family sulfur transferase n=1 Tax=Methylophilus flavus TaxID=640084 RepID=A0ABW3PN60_9PROT
MEVKQIDQRFSVAGQLNEADLEEIADQGFKLVINFRPDGEGGESQPSSTVLAEKAQALGLQYAYIPVVPNQVQTGDVDQLRSFLEQHPGQALGFCRTGNRASNVYQQVLQSTSQASTGKPACCQPQNESQTLSSRVMDWIKR